MKLLKTIKSCTIFLMLLAFISGCYTLDSSHNNAHNRALKSDVGGMHEDIDSFLGLNEASVLNSEK